MSKYAHLETHHEWLSDLINFANTLKSLAMIIAILIVGITTVAIAAGMRTRVEIHQHEVELLHHIGATDRYIILQFQRHAMILALIGGIIGTILGICTTLLVMFLSHNSGTSLIPVIEISLSAFFMLCLIPIIIAGIAIITSYFTVLRQLLKMP